MTTPITRFAGDTLQQHQVFSRDGEESGPRARLERSIHKLPAERRPIVTDFIQEMRTNGASASTQQAYVAAIRKLSKFTGKPFDRLTKSDIKDWSDWLNKELSANSYRTYRSMVKKFLKYVHNGDLEKGEYPNCVEWIKTRSHSRDLEQEVLREDEIKAVIGEAQTQRNRTLIFVCYEAGLRRGELTSMRVKDVKFDKHGAVLRVRGKTGGRRIRVINAVADLKLYLSIHHPQADDPQAPLWPSRKRGENGEIRGITPDQVYHIIRRLSRKALGRPINPHALRHSRATHLANGVLTEAQMREFFGWSKGSDQPERYTHLSGRDVDKSLLENEGIDIEEEDRESGQALAKIECPSCEFENPPGSRFCARCSLPLDDRTAFEVQATRNKAEEIQDRLNEWLINNAGEILKRGLRETGVGKELEDL